MQLELSLRIPTAVDRRTPLRFVVHAAAGLLAAALLVLFAATDAAAADDVGGLITETVARVEPIVEPPVDVVEPTEPIVEPVMEPIVGQLSPILEPVAPVDPTDPIGPILDGTLPVTPPLLPPLDLPGTDSVLGTARHGSAVPIDGAAATAVDAAILLESNHVDAASDTPIPHAAAVEATLAEPGGTFELPSLPSGPAVDAGTAVTFLAALLIGLSMVAPSGWGTNSLVTRLRPIGLTLSPPVPPG